ncbi:unnamed protein product [Medioppia subpectinata]|uniref:RRM domain-containing protein n=1 Tax=Medioppia subpectinata TaxID=1979941 RepID=A0A7R9PWL7_9ACAR|nr:unnamed protein product [Medioppia subpectinata]CAG2103906.1 unnamed protein product [Medioppia subpectinata]
MTTPEVSQRLQDLVNTTGYEITQRCGQRFYGPPPNWSDTDRPERGCEVFVGRLPRDLFEDELVPVMSSVAPIYQLRLIMDFSGTNKGFAFVTYTRRWAAIQAIRQLNNYEIRPNHRIGVTQSLDNCRLFLGNLPLNKTRQEVEEEISSKTKGVVNVIVYYNSYESIPNGSNGCDGQPKTRGFAFVEYESHRAAAMARKCLLPGSKSGKVSLFGVQVTLDWAIPEQRADKQLMDRTECRP